MATCAPDDAASEARGPGRGADLSIPAVILSWLVDKPVALKPLLVSKLNTVAQIALACVIMAARGFDFDAGIAVMVLTALVAALTLLSIAFYVAEWVRHMNAAETGP